MDYFGARDLIRKRLTRRASDALLSYHYPGNVRQLMNICERLVVMTETELIDVRDLPVEIGGGSDQEPGAQEPWADEGGLQQALDSFECAILKKALEKHGNQVRTAAALGVNQSTIARKLKKHGLC